MNFSFWPFLSFGLPGRLLMSISNAGEVVGDRSLYYTTVGGRDWYGHTLTPFPITSGV